MYISVEVNFADTVADVKGYYYPPCGKDLSDFVIDGFFIGEDDILSEVSEMFVKQNNGRFVGYLESIEEQLLLQADNYYNSMGDLNCQH